MNQTANYQLNQWQKQDRIMMSDFNADNLKLDAALAAQVSALAAEETARKDADAAETSARKSADAALDAKIDAHPAFEKLWDVTTTAQAQLVELDCSAVDLSQYFYLVVTTKMTGSGTLRLYLNDFGSDHNCNYPGIMNTSVSCLAYAAIGTPLMVLLMPHKDGSDTIHAISKTNTGFGNGKRTGLTWSEVQTLKWYVPGTDTYIAAGSRFTVWGVK